MIRFFDLVQPGKSMPGWHMTKLVDLAHHQEAYGEGQQEDKLRKDECEQHWGENLLVSLRLSSDSLKTAAGGQTLTYSYSETCDADGESDSYRDVIHLVKFPPTV
jgi:hypothetical protein